MAELSVRARGPVWSHIQHGDSVCRVPGTARERGGTCSWIGFLLKDLTGKFSEWSKVI